MMFDPQQLLSGAGDLFGGMFGRSGDPYDKAMGRYREYEDKAAGAQQPYMQAGQGAIGNYQNWLQKQQNPTQFINDAMKGYSQSPYAKYLQQQSMNAGQNAASASGMMGSTPMMQQMQQNAANISSGDMNQWLQHVLGINTQYGQGQNNLMQGGQNSANALTNLYNQSGQRMGDAEYGKEAGNNQDFWSMLGGGLNMLGSFF